MPKIPALTPKKIIKILEKKGYVLDRFKGSHHIYYHPEMRKRVVVPLHKKELPRGPLNRNPKTGGNKQRRTKRSTFINI